MTSIDVTSLLASIILVASLEAARADESDFSLTQAPGVDVVEGNCASCHSLDMIQMNNPVQDEKGWTETVGKMVHVMGAPISEDDRKQIIAYLTAHYSK